MRTVVLVAMLLAQGTGAPRQMGVISGQVLQKNGGSAEGVRVAAMEVPESGKPAADALLAGLALTDASGRYRLDDVPPGNYFVIAGFLDSPTYYPGVIPQAQAKPIIVTGGKTLAGIDFKLAQSSGAKVTGRMTGLPPGFAAGLIRMSLLPSTGGRPGRTPMEAVVRPDGSFDFSKVPPGTHRVASSVPMQPVEKTITVEDTDVDFEVPAPPMLFGRITVDDGSKLPAQAAAVAQGAAGPPPLARIQARRVATGVAANTLLQFVGIVYASNGSFFLTAPAGEYQLSAALLPFGYSIKSMSWGSADLTQTALKIPDVLEATMPEIHVVLTTELSPNESRGVTVRGKVLGFSAALWALNATPQWVTMQANTPVNGVALTRAGEARIQPDGTFEVSRVPPGTYLMRPLPSASSRITSVTVSDHDIDDVELSLSPLTALSLGSAVTNVNTLPGLRASSLANLLPTIVQPGFKVSGTVVVPPNASRPQAVQLFGNGQASQSFRTGINSDGSFEFPTVPSGAYDLALVPLELPPTSTPITVNGADLAGLRIEASAGADFRARTVVSNGRPLPPAVRLTLRLVTPQDYMQVASRSDGSFTQRVRQGEYRLVVEDIPVGFAIGSVIQGTTDLGSAPLKINLTAPIEVVITLVPTR